MIFHKEHCRPNVGNFRSHSFGSTYGFPIRFPTLWYSVKSKHHPIHKEAYRVFCYYWETNNHTQALFRSAMLTYGKSAFPNLHGLWSQTNENRSQTKTKWRNDCYEIRLRWIGFVRTSHLCKHIHTNVMYKLFLIDSLILLVENQYY